MSHAIDEDAYLIKGAGLGLRGSWTERRDRARNMRQDELAGDETFGSLADGERPAPGTPG